MPVRTPCIHMEYDRSYPESGQFPITQQFMPFPRSWLPRISEILTVVDGWPAKEFDRDAVIQIFALKRRAALSLMKEVGPLMLRSGRWVIPRERLLGFLHSQTDEAE